MGIKGWFENKLAERKAKQEQQKAVAHMHADPHRVSTHDASKRGYRHNHGEGFITRWTFKDPVTGKKKTAYKHRPGWNATVPDNWTRVFTKRCQNDLAYADRANAAFIAGSARDYTPLIETAAAAFA